MPLVTVVIPTYRRTALLLETLRSVMAQSFTEFEVIVVDDCSPVDPTPEIARLFPDIKVLRQPTNQGVGAARNLGIGQAAGDYIAFLDDDDLWPPWTLATYAAAIERHDRPAVISLNGVAFKARAELEDQRQGPIEEEVFADYLTYRNNPRQRGWLTTCGMAVRRDCLLGAGGFDAAFTYHEDEDMWLKLGTAASFVRLAQPYCWFYRSHVSMSSDLSVRFHNIERLIDKERSGAYPGGRSRSRHRIEVIAHNARHLARRGAREGFVAAAARLYGKMLDWNLSLARWKFLSVFPAELLVGRFLRRLKVDEAG